MQQGEGKGQLKKQMLSYNERDRVFREKIRKNTKIFRNTHTNKSKYILKKILTNNRQGKGYG